MPSVSVNPPKTPVTKGSNSVAAATVPNVCKMPGPPAPFVPTPLPNIGRSSLSPEGFTTTVMVEGQPVAIRGASFKSMGDVASQGTGGVIVSNNVEGPTKFVAPGSLTVQFEGKNVHYLGDQMVNNCGPGGSPPNAATMMGVVHAPGAPMTSLEEELEKIVCKCDRKVKPNKQSTCRKLGQEKHDCCNKEVQKLKNKTGPGRQQQFAQERGYTDPDKPPVRRIQMTRLQSWISKENPRSCWPDAVLLDEKGNPKQLFEFKFKCPAGVRTRKKKNGTWATCTGQQPSPGWRSYKGGGTQEIKYMKLGAQLGINNKTNPPTIVNNEGC
jgi:uncharacterized Zn-binding protein involved in type VI secretion